MRPLIFALLALVVAACHELAPVSAPEVPFADPRGKGFVAPASAPRPPMSLTASDGTGLTLLSLRVGGVVEDPLSLTELELEFENPRDETIEGRFEIALPPGARVTRFAMQIAGAWQEAEVVERQEARVAYESFLHQKRDPALLELKAGNLFRARVFPIAPRERKRLIVSYAEHHADATKPYTVRLRGLPWLHELDARVLVARLGKGSYRVVESKRSDFRPNSDLVVPREVKRSTGSRSGRHVVARIEPLEGHDPGEAERPRDWTILFDTSASRALDYAAKIEQLGAFVRALQRRSPADATLRMIAFDQASDVIYSGSLDRAGQGMLDALQRRTALGASDLAGALETAGRSRTQRVVIFTDGMATVGITRRKGLTQRIVNLEADGTQRVDVVLSGRAFDHGLLRALVTAGLPADGLVLGDELAADTAVDRVLRPTVSGVNVDVDGATWVWPSRLDGIQPGDTTLVFAELDPKRSVKVQLTGAVARTLRPEVRASKSPLVEDAVTGAKVEHLIASLSAGDGDRTGRRASIIDLSIQHRIFNAYTAFLVLETELDYSRFGFDRRGLSDILTVGRTGVTAIDRTLPPGIVAPGGTEPTPPRRRTGRGSIVGVVRDSGTGKPLPNALVVLQCNCLRSLRETFTNANGLYAFRNLPSGGYTIQAHAGEASVTKAMDLARGEKVRVRFSVNPRSVRKMVVGGREVKQDRAVSSVVVTKEEFRGIPGRDAGGVAAPRPDPGRTISMEEFRHIDPIPAGNTAARDFKAVVESGATASRDSAGISLAGSTAAEAKYRLGPPTRDKVPKVKRGAMLVKGVTRRSARRMIEEHLAQIESCYHDALRSAPRLQGRLVVDLEIERSGVVRGVVRRNTLGNRELARCVEDAAARWGFGPTPKAGGIRQSLTFTPGDPPGPPVGRAPEPAPSPYDGPMAEIMVALAKNELDQAAELAWAWRAAEPDDAMALVALGEVGRAAHDLRLAARAFGSIIDLFPSRADMRRFAGGRLEGLGAVGLELAIDTYRKARAQRPDHPSSHRLLAFALLRKGRHRAAFDVLQRALLRSYPDGRFAGVQRVLREDAGIVGAAWIKAQPRERTAVQGKVASLGAVLATQPSLRFVLTWETDANDVDLHVTDGRGDRAYYGQPSLASGGQLYADVTNGYGPECLTVPTANTFPYRVQVHYYARGPMGYGMGKVQIVRHDGEGGVRLDDRPFVAMRDRTYVDLGFVEGPG